jgi:hypothetical protein
MRREFEDGIVVAVDDATGLLRPISGDVGHAGNDLARRFEMRRVDRHRMSAATDADGMQYRRDG